MFDLVFQSNAQLVFVIILLEVFLCVDSIALAISCKKKWVKVIHILLAVIWAVCAVMNYVHF